ncbi:MAG: prepilin-type N-terminal cleavage/methylation domain-containing protein [Pseudomonadota bacterium]|nr:prepilin-type N-terminal cleavage/methylation domain-containing protein [Pseudomonadota bacterium]
MSAHPTLRPRQRGITLLEGLIAFFVLSVGMLAVGRVQTQFRLTSDIARQRTEAVRLGQQDIEALRSFAVLTVASAAAGAKSYAEIASGVVAVDPDVGYVTNTRFQLSRDVQAAPSANAKSVHVTVGWADRSGAAQQIVLDSIIAAADPLHSAALGLARSEPPLKGAYGRSIFVPLAAKNLGSGSSVFKPPGAGSVAYVFDNATGFTNGRCTGIDPARATGDLTAADLAVCDSSTGYLLSGIVRFSLASPPDAARATDAPLELAVAATTSGASAAMPPSCDSAALKTVTYSRAGMTRVEQVPIAATPAAFGLATWSESGDRYVAYHCIVHPLPNGEWSGRTLLVASGWTIGASATARRVCRYSADADGSGAIDANIEHPTTYAAVRGPLLQQNFLVIAGSETCPAGAPVRIDGSAGDVFVSAATVQHQP